MKQMIVSDKSGLSFINFVLSLVKGECAKLRSLRAHVPYMPSFCVPCKPSFFTCLTYLPFLCALRVFIF